MPDSTKPATPSAGIDVKAIQNLQSKIVAAATAFTITDLQVQFSETEFFISVKGVKKAMV